MLMTTMIVKVSETKRPTVIKVIVAETHNVRSYQLKNVKKTGVQMI